MSYMRQIKIHTENKRTRMIKTTSRLDLCVRLAGLAERSPSTQKCRLVAALYPSLLLPYVYLE